MLWFVYAHNIPTESFDLVITDEIQDFNALQRWLAFRSMGSNGRFIGVGDDRQAIYGFAGASVDSMDRIIDDLTNNPRGVKVMPLTFTRRSPVSHIDLARQIVDDIEALHDAKIGSVESIAMNYALDIASAGNMMICRRNAPLISAAYKFIQMGKPVLVRGRDIGKGMQALIRKLRATDIESLIVKAEQYRTRELTKLDAKGKKADSAKVALNDKIDTLIALTDGMNDLSELRAKIDGLFSDDNDTNKIVLSTVHKAKGLEADTVFILDYSRIRIPLTQDWQQTQEANLEYIALTRSTDRLYLID
jgi:superfamily I DNA/RNA helicase